MASEEITGPELWCAHCGAHFVGTKKQAQHIKYSGMRAFCSPFCRVAARTKGGIPREHNHGPCPTCGEMFFSRVAKTYCSMACYTRSIQYQEMLRCNREAIGNRRRCSGDPGREKNEGGGRTRSGEMVACLECGGEYFRKPKRKKQKFCSTVCYRSYMAKRYDRWVANPEAMQLPQCYDEFLDRAELGCLVDGCGWSGQHLSAHMNMAHGVPAKEFKRAVGFNVTTGVVARPLAEAMSQRRKDFFSNDERRTKARLCLLGSMGKDSAGVSEVSQYRSLEAREHGHKGRSMAGDGPRRVCQGCGAEFQQSTAFGRARYCSPGCRDDHYAHRRHEATRDRGMVRVRNPDGTFRWERLVPSNGVLTNANSGVKLLNMDARRDAGGGG
jgi:hypothetical protein